MSGLKRVQTGSNQQLGSTQYPLSIYLQLASQGTQQIAVKANVSNRDGIYSTISSDDSMSAASAERQVIDHQDIGEGGKNVKQNNIRGQNLT